MYKGPRLKTAPFAPFSRAFLPERLMRETGFIKSADTPYERNTATKDSHHEFFKITQESMFGSPSQKVLRLDVLRERFVISDTEKGRGHFLTFTDIKEIKIDEANIAHVLIKPLDTKLREMSFTMESPEVASKFVQRLETLVQARRMGPK